MLAFAANFVRDHVNRISDFVKVGESFFYTLVDYLIELCIWCWKFWHAVHTKLEGSSSDDALNESIFTDPRGKKSSPTIC